MSVGCGQGDRLTGLGRREEALGDIRDTCTVLWVVLWKFTVLWK